VNAAAGEQAGYNGRRNLPKSCLTLSFDGNIGVPVVSEINIPAGEISALKAIDERVLRQLIDEAIQGEDVTILGRMPVSSCGTYVTTELGHLQKAIASLCAAKSAKNIESKRSDAERAGRNLFFAVSSMIKRMEAEEQDAELFRINDDMYWPHRFTPDLKVTISYRWPDIER
jgi:hypothetical protein